MDHPTADVSEIEEVAMLIAPFDTVRATVGPWLAGFGRCGVRHGHNVIWVWSEIDAFPAKRFDHRHRKRRIAALRRFTTELAEQGNRR